jgi:hypothetical protein
MPADEHGKDLHDCGVVSFGVAGDAFKRLYATDAYVKPPGAEVIDRLGEPVGHLPFAEQGEVPHRTSRGRAAQRLTLSPEDVRQPGLHGRLDH